MPADRLYAPEYFARREVSPLFRFEMDFLARGLAGHRVLEVGCGTGALGRRIVAIGAADYVGTDVVAQPGNEPDVLCDATALPFGDARFTAVISQHVVEHLPQPERFLQEARRVLVPGGLLRFTTPNARYPDPAMFADPTHVAVRDIRGWADALTAAGFENKVTSHFAYLGRPRLLYTAARLTNIWPRGGVRGAVIFAEALVPGTGP